MRGVMATAHTPSGAIKTRPGVVRLVHTLDLRIAPWLLASPRSTFFSCTASHPSRLTAGKLRGLPLFSRAPAARRRSTGFIVELPFRAREERSGQ